MKVAKTKKSRPTNTNEEIIFVAPDEHNAPKNSDEGGIDPRAESVALQAIGIVKPTIKVKIGDVGEWNSVSPWKYKKEKRPPIKYVLRDLKKDYEAVNLSMDKWDRELESTPCYEKHFITGNHEVWVENFMLETPDLDDKFSIENGLRLKERGYIYHKYGKYVKFGKLHMYHGGHFSGKYHAHKHVDQLGANVMYGHTHDVQSAKNLTLGGMHGAWSIGCLCKLEKNFLKGRPTNWSHAFAIVYLDRKSGDFSVEMIDIVNGKCHVNGVKIRG